MRIVASSPQLVLITGVVEVARSGHSTLKYFFNEIGALIVDSTVDELSCFALGFTACPLIGGFCFLLAYQEDTQCLRPVLKKLL